MQVSIFSSTFDIIIIAFHLLSIKIKLMFVGSLLCIQYFNDIW